MNTRTLLERRATLVAEMRGITTSPAGNGGDLSTEQSQKFDTLKADLEQVERGIERARVLEDAERRMQGQQIAGTGDDRFDTACREFSLRAAIAGAAGMNVDNGKEKEISAELARRAGRPFQGIAVPMNVFHLEKRTLQSTQGSPDSGGASLIPTDFRPDQFVDMLRAKMVTRRLGARVLSGLQGNVEFPKQASAAASAWVAEDSALSAGDPTFQKIQMQPKTCGALSEFTRNMLLQSSPDIEQLLRMDFAAVLANALDVAAINGSGGNDPFGILNVSGLGTVSAPLTWATVLELIEAVEEANTEGTGWATTPAVKRLLRSTLRASSTDSRTLMESPNELAGYPLMSTTNVPNNLDSPPDSHALIFGNWSDLLIGFWSELDVLVNPYESAAYTRGNVRVRAMMSVDIAARHIESFAAMTNVSPG